jgi:hypothetical protein
MAHMLGRVVGFGVEAAEDAKGLRVKAQFTLDSDEGRNAAAVVRHAAKVGHKVGLSIGYKLFKDGAEFDDATGVRRLKSVDLLEYSIAAVPANPRARIKAAAGERFTVREIEGILRDAGFARDEAKCLISSLKDQRDVEPETAPQTAALADLAAQMQAALRDSELLMQLRRV